MKRILFTMLLAASLSAEAQTQTYETEFARPLNEVLTDIQNRFGVRLKYDIDTVGKVLSYADFRIRPYSVEESLTEVNSVPTIIMTAFIPQIFRRVRFSVS